MEHSSLLNLLWSVGHLTGGDFTSVGGERIELVGEGERSESQGVWLSAEVVVDGERRRGIVAVGSETEVPAGTILRVVECDLPGVLGDDDLLVPQIQYNIEPRIIEWYDTLRRGAGGKKCAAKIAGMDPVRRVELFSALLVRRLQRKTARVTEVFEAAQKDWNQTFHELLLQAMGGNRNKEVFAEVARRVTAAMISREKGRPETAVVLLLGGAGLLKEDDAGADEFRHLAAKYSITPLRSGEWDLTKLYPVNHPASRLRQIAALLCKKDFMLDGMLACRTSEEIERLFTLPAVPVGERLSQSARSIGRSKSQLVGINMAAPLMFAYGKETGAEELCDRALDLLSSIPAEDNSKLSGWYSGGCMADSAFDSQALLELGNEFCDTGRCSECRICRSEIKKML